MFHVPVLKHAIDLYPLLVVSTGKLATLFYFSAFTILLRSWNDVCDVTQSNSSSSTSNNEKGVLALHHRNSRRFRSSQILYVLVNVWMYVIECAIVAAKTLFPTHHVVTTWIKSDDSVVIAAFFLALGIGMTTVGLKLRRLFYTIEFSSTAALLSRRILTLTIIFSIIFASRAILFLYVRKLDLWMVYTVPELVPGLSVLIMMRVSSKGRAEKVSNEQESLRPLLLRNNDQDDNPATCNYIL